MGKKLIRQALQDYLNTADDEIVQSIYNLVKNSIPIPSTIIDETIEISKRVKNGAEKTYSEKQFKKIVAKQFVNESATI